MRSRHRIHDGWWFHRGELATPPSRGSSKAGACGGASDLVTDELPAGAHAGDADLLGAMIPGFAEASPAARPGSLGTGWRDVRLPHDWRIEQAPSPDGPIWQAFLPGGIAYYRRRFPMPEHRPGDRIVLEFEGVMRDATVWCNGFFLGDHLSGYTGFRYDVTELLRSRDEGDNVVLVRCDTTAAEGWWYEGGGIYRNVWLTTLPSLHVDLDGVWVTTPDVAPDHATIQAAVTVRNHAADPVDARVRTIVIDPGGTIVAAAQADVTVPASDAATAITRSAVPSPRLWAIHDAQLYVLTAEIEVDGTVIDRTHTCFGIRTIEFRPGHGLFVNGKHVLLQGANIHQDFAGVGVALPDRIIEHKLRLLTEMGCNAVRSAHHPPAPALLDAADRLGLLVIAENRLMSTAPPYLADLENMVITGRNHPCVFLWSLENEEYLEGTERGTRILGALVRTVRRLDPTRPTIVGGARDFDSPFFDVADVVGAHYQSLNQLIGEVQALRPASPLVADEEGLFPTVRGQYDDDHVRGLPSSFGTSMGLFGAFPKIMAAVTGRDPIDYDLGATWRWFIEHPEAAGGFVWAGFDYFGEPTPMHWPVMVSNYGAMDLCGFPKDYYWLLRSWFRPEPLVHVLPHWTWPGSEGKPLRVWAYSNCDEVELLINGAVIDRRPVVDHIAKWDDGIVYEPGVLLARGLRAGIVVAEHRSETAGPPRRLNCTLEPAILRGDGDDVAIVTVAVEDADGRLCPWADDDIVFDVVGPAELIGVGNGDPTSLEPHKGRHRRAFRGRALALVRALAGPGGTVDVHVSAERLQEGSLSFVVTPADDRTGDDWRSHAREPVIS